MSINGINRIDSSLESESTMTGLRKITTQIKNHYKTIIYSLILSATLSGCGNETENNGSVILERQKNVLIDGTIAFLKGMDSYLTLEDLSPDETFLLIASQETQKEMNISAKGAFRVYKADENMYNDDVLLVKKGYFFTKLSSGDIIRVVISNGDIIIDSLSEDFHKKPNGSPLSKNIMSEVSKLLSSYSQSAIKSIYSERFPDYHDLITNEYKELLTQDGISLETSFASYLLWLEQNDLGISESTMKQYLDQFVTKTPIEEPESDSSNTIWSTLGAVASDLRDSISQGLENLGPSMSNDDKILSYENERFGKSDIMRKDHGALPAIVRLQGHFFDQFTYNRLTGDFYSKVSVKSFENQEYVALSNLRESLSPNAPGDIHKNAKKGVSMIDIINHSTTLNVEGDHELKKALQFSFSPGSNDTELSDFKVTYTSGGAVQAIEYQSQPLNISRIYIEPSFLRKLSGDTAEIEIGDYSFTSNLNDYFDQYKTLEAQNKGIDQTLWLFDTDTGEFSTMRNMLWFIEKDVDLYKQLAEDITKGSSSNIEKLQKLLTWVQVNASYIAEISEINKIALGTLWDRGGDCEDGFILFKTLAEHIGLGDHVGAVYFKSHIAPMIKGDHGPTVYNIDGSSWTIAELATQKGETAPLGRTNQTDPLFYMLQNDKIVPAQSNIVSISMVSESNIDPVLVADFNGEVKKINKLVSLSKDGGSSIQEIQVFIDNLTAAFHAIAQKGKLSEGIYDSYIEHYNALLQLQQNQAKIEQDMKNALMLENYAKHPKLVQELISQFDELNAATSGEKMEALVMKIELIVQRHKGYKSNYSIAKQLRSAIVNAIDDSKISINIDKIRKLYNEKKMGLPESYSNALVQVTQIKINAMNYAVLVRYNEVGNILRNRRR